MNDSLISRASSVALTAAVLALAACGGGGSANNPTAGNSGGSAAPPATTTTTTAGLWKGTITSTTTAQSAAMVTLVGPDGSSVWMTTDGRVFNGTMPMTGDHFDARLAAHMDDSGLFPDGTNHGIGSMMVDTHTTGMMGGRFSGNGDAGTFTMSLSPMWGRPSALGTVAGVYTRSTSTGYTMTMTISANGQLSASDSRGCIISGAVTVPDPTHNLYRMEATVTSCGSLDGSYQGMGALLDADAMQDWMSAMRPLEHGGHMVGGSSMMGGNTIPTGQRNLFMFSLTNGQNALMDALAK